MELKALENTILAHRYLYYVLCTPIIADRDYDLLEREAQKLLPMESVVHQPGSDLVDSYSSEVKALAKKMFLDVMG